MSNWNEIKDSYMHEVKKQFSLHINIINDIDTLNQDDVNHILEVGCSILLSRDGHITAGSFAMAVVRNDLYNALTLADSISTKALKFFVHIGKWVKPGITFYEHMT